MNEVKVGVVTNYFRKVSVAAVELTDGNIAIGDTILFCCYCDDVETCVNSMEIDHKQIKNANKGETVGIRVPERVWKGDEVYKRILA